MKKTITLYDFRNEFQAIRPGNFSYEGLEALFELLEALEELLEDFIRNKVISHPQWYDRESKSIREEVESLPVAVKVRAAIRKAKGCE